LKNEIEISETVSWRRQQAFSLVEIVIVVALIGLLATLLLPGISLARKQSQGKRIVSDARVIDSAIDAWAMENQMTDGDPVDTTAIASYSKSGTLNMTDILGNDYGIGPVGSNQVRISTVTKSALTGAQIDWGAY
jgi:prepilin-type N-terminal cleavage/methylation domain-containing protein